MPFGNMRWLDFVDKAIYAYSLGFNTREQLLFALEMKAIIFPTAVHFFHFSQKVQIPGKSFGTGEV